jgi:hypothetical protein
MRTYMLKLSLAVGRPGIHSAATACVCVQSVRRSSDHANVRISKVVIYFANQPGCRSYLHIVFQCGGYTWGIGLVTVLCMARTSNAVNRSVYIGVPNGKIVMIYQE